MEYEGKIKNEDRPRVRQMCPLVQNKTIFVIVSCQNRTIKQHQRPPR